MSRSALLILSLLATACHAQNRGIVGNWKNDPRATQLGETTDEICFKSDGTYVAHATTQAAVLTNAGKYEIHGKELHLIAKEGTEKDIFELRGDTLITREMERYKPLRLEYNR